ncbi:MAG TPA: lysylphosphatidylglycerol synthase domain-containing protein [Nocardioides sp.]|nr:lysylphosphatidylglycerol synthase domain-containing protein [Nocardioides sp.]
MTSPARWAGRAAGAAVLVVLVMRFGREPFRHGLVSVGPAALAVALAVGALTTLACAWRWRLVARHLGLELPWGVSFAACYRAALLNASLPGGVLGDVHRAVDRGRHTRATGLAVRSVAWERGLGQLVQVVVALLLLRLWIAALAAAVLLVAVLARFRPVAAGIVVASLVAVAGYAFMFMVAAAATGTRPPLSVVLLVLLAAAVPLNLGGWGPREGAAAGAFAAVGLGAEHGLAASVAYGVMALVSTLPGLLVLLLPRLTRGTDRPVPETPEVSRA